MAFGSTHSCKSVELEMCPNIYISSMDYSAKYLQNKFLLTSDEYKDDRISPSTSMYIAKFC